jgi:site-specific recombinase XerC
MTLTIDEPPVVPATNPQRMELTDAVEYFLLSIEAEGLSKRTLALYSDVLRRMVAFARKHNRAYIDELTPTVLRGAVAEIKTQPGRSTNFKRRRGDTAHFGVGSPLTFTPHAG